MDSAKKKKKSNKITRCPILHRDYQLPVIREGWLHKLSHGLPKTWKKRWFVLSNYCLFYYKDSEENELHGSILLPSYQIKPYFGDLTQKYAFKAEHQNMKSFYLAADSLETMKLWMNDLTRASIMYTNTPSLSDLTSGDEDSGFTSYSSKTCPFENHWGYSPNPLQPHNSQCTYEQNYHYNPSIRPMKNNYGNPGLSNDLRFSPAAVASHPSLVGSRSHHENMSLYSSSPRYSSQPHCSPSKNPPFAHSHYGSASSARSQENLMDNTASGTFSNCNYNDVNNRTVHFDKSIISMNDHSHTETNPHDSKKGQKGPQPLYANAPPKPKRTYDIFSDEDIYRTTSVHFEAKETKPTRPQSADFLEKDHHSLEKSKLGNSVDDLRDPRHESMKRLLEWKQRMLQSPLTRNALKAPQPSVPTYYHHQQVTEEFRNHDAQLYSDHKLPPKPIFPKPKPSDHQPAQADYVNVRSLHLSPLESSKISLEAELVDEEGGDFFKREDYFRASQMFYSNKKCSSPSHSKLKQMSSDSSLSTYSKSSDSQRPSTFIWDLDKDVGLPLPPCQKSATNNLGSISCTPKTPEFNKEIRSITPLSDKTTPPPNIVQERIKHFEKSPSKNTKKSPFEKSSSALPCLKNNGITLSPLSSVLADLRKTADTETTSKSQREHDILPNKKTIKHADSSSFQKDDEEAYISMNSISEDEPVYVSMDESQDTCKEMPNKEQLSVFINDSLDYTSSSETLYKVENPHLALKTSHKSSHLSVDKESNASDADDEASHDFNNHQTVANVHSCDSHSSSIFSYSTANNDNFRPREETYQFDDLDHYEKVRNFCPLEISDKAKANPVKSFSSYPLTSSSVCDLNAPSTLGLNTFEYLDQIKYSSHYSNPSESLKPSTLTMKEETKLSSSQHNLAQPSEKTSHPDIIPVSRQIVRTINSAPYYYSDIYEAEPSLQRSLMIKASQNAHNFLDPPKKEGILKPMKEDKVSMLASKEKLVRGSSCKDLSSIPKGTSADVHWGSKMGHQTLKKCAKSMKKRSATPDFDVISRNPEPCYENLPSLSQRLSRSLEGLTSGHDTEPLYENIFANSFKNLDTLEQESTSGISKEPIYSHSSTNETEKAGAISAGDLLGKSHEELVLLLISLRRNQATLAEEIERLEEKLHDGQGNPTVLQAKLEDLHSQYKAGYPLVSLVDSMVKLGTMYDGTLPSLESNGDTDPEPLSSTAQNFNEKLQKMIHLDQTLQEETENYLALHREKALLEQALESVKGKFHESQYNSLEYKEGFNLQKKLENEIAELDQYISSYSKNFKALAEDDIEVEKELSLIRQRMKNSVYCKLGEAADSKLEEMLQELARRKSQVAAQVQAEVRASPTGVVGASALPLGRGKKTTPPTYLETDLDSMETKDLASKFTLISDQDDEKNGQTNVFYENAIPKSTSAEYTPSYMQDISEADDKMKRFYGILPREKPLEVKTVRIVKRESERRIRRERGKKDSWLEEDIEVPKKESLLLEEPTRSRDDTDLERCLKSVNTPDIVRSTIKKSSFIFDDTLIDQVLGLPQKIPIPERYIEEEPERLSASEKLKRTLKAENIKKMLSSTTVDVAPDKKEEKKRAQLLSLNHTLAREVMERSKVVAAPQNRPKC